MATLATIRNDAKQVMGLAQAASTAEETLIDEWANEAVIDVLIRTQCHVNCLTMNLTANQFKYDLPVEILAIKEVYRDSDGEPLIPVSPEEIVDFRRSVVSTGADTTRTRYAVLGSNFLVLWPTPTTAFTIDLWYVPLPTAMTTGANDPAVSTYGKIPVQFHPALKMYVLWKAGEYANDKPSGNGASFMAQYENFLRRTLLPAQNRMSNSRLSTARVGRRPQRYITPNDQYPRGY